MIGTGRSARVTLPRVQANPTMVRPPASPAIRRFDPRNLRAAWWAWRAAVHTRRSLRSGGLDAAVPPPAPPALPSEALRGVHAVLYRRGETCVVRSIVLQAWLAAHGEPRDLIVGVAEPGDAFEAHAWLEGEPPHDDGPFHELLRRPAPQVRT
jgi:Transglutaminase-like superfamily